MNKYEMCGKEYPIIGYVDAVSPDGVVATNIPLLDIPMISDYQWMEMLRDQRVKHPEYFQDTEDVPATIARLEKWLNEHKKRD